MVYKYICEILPVAITFEGCLRNDYTSNIYMLFNTQVALWYYRNRENNSEKLLSNPTPSLMHM